MSGALSLRFSAQTQLTVGRISRELSDLQRQVASGLKADDLRSLGAAASQLLNAKSAKAATDARSSAIDQLDARFGVQSLALNQAASANSQLAQAIRQAVSADDGRGVNVELEQGFSNLVSALNQTWNGQPLFAGERQGVGPVRVKSLSELLIAVTPDLLFDEAARQQVVDLGSGTPVALADKASVLATDSFNTLRDLKTFIDAAGGAIGAPLTGVQRDQLLNIASRLEQASNTLTNAEGRTGQVQKRLASESLVLRERSNLLIVEIGEQADADLAQISVRLNSLLAQYEATAKTFSDLSKLTLLDYL